MEQMNTKKFNNQVKLVVNNKRWYWELEKLFFQKASVLLKQCNFIVKIDVKMSSMDFQIYFS